MHVLLSPLKFLYGLYATFVWALCLLIGGAIVLLLPGLSWRRHVARRALRIMFFASAMPYRFEHLQRLPSGACVVIANHRSYLDGLVLIAALPPHFSPVIKHEISQVPVIGTVLRRVGARFVRRQPAMTAGRDTLDMMATLREGQSLAIFPEGTFSTDSGLLPFREGAFFMAAKAGVPVVPVAIQGARRVLPKPTELPRPGSVTLDVLDPVWPAGETRADADRLRDRVEAVLSGGLKSSVAHPSGTQRDCAFYCKAFAGHARPFAYLDLDLLERNIRTVLERSGGKRLRVDGRVLRCPTVIDRVCRSDVRFHGVKCATVAEALYLARAHGFDDLLVAYPVVQQAAIERVCDAIAEGRSLTLTVDSRAHVDRLCAIARAAGVTVPLCIEMDISAELLGAGAARRRSAVCSVADLLALAADIGARDGVALRGLSVFDAQRDHLRQWFDSARGQGGRARRKPVSERGQRRLRAQRHAAVERLREQGLTPEIVNCAGVGSIEFNALDSAVTEITVGAAFYGLKDAPDAATEDIPAAGYAAEIMRRPADDIYVCLAGGYTAPDTADPAILPHPYLPPGARLDSLSGAGEGQLPIRYTGALDLGDTVFMRPANAGELCERFSQLLLVQDGVVVATADTYRALGDQFLHDAND